MATHTLSSLSQPSNPPPLSSLSQPPSPLAITIANRTIMKVLARVLFYLLQRIVKQVLCDEEPYKLEAAIQFLKRKLTSFRSDERRKVLL